MRISCSVNSSHGKLVQKFDHNLLVQSIVDFLLKKWTMCLVGSEKGLGGMWNQFFDLFTTRDRIYRDIRYPFRAERLKKRFSRPWEPKERGYHCYLCSKFPIFCDGRKKSFIRVEMDQTPINSFKLFGQHFSHVFNTPNVCTLKWQSFLNNPEHNIHFHAHNLLIILLILVFLFYGK